MTTDRDPSTKLVIPYHADDLGVRPQTKTPSWSCSAIRVNGTPALGVYTPGVPLRINVDVTNHGAGTNAAPVYVTVWWTEPGTGFALTGANVLGQTSFPVASHGVTVTSPDIVGTIPASAPSHVCLIVRAVSPGDTLPAGATADPVGDRHWAQLNLNTVVAARGEGFDFSFWAVNAGADEAEFEVRLRPVDEEGLRYLSHQLRAEAVSADGVRMWLGEDEGATSSRVALRAGQRSPLSLRGRIGDAVPAGAFTAIEALQYDRDHLTGSLGLILFGAR